MSPRDGDLVIVRSTDSEYRFEVEIVPGRPQMRYRTRDEALRQACQMARHGAIDVWYREGAALSMVESFRVDY